VEPDRWNAVWAVFHQALDEPAVGRARLLERLCAGDQELRREVDALLVAHQREGLLDQAEQALLEDSRPSFEGRRLGAYRLVCKLGAGGMGTVFLGERVDDEFEQRVAVKLIQPGLDGEEIGRRFQQERRILARLDHPYIARLFDGGQWEGMPYFVLEYVEGETIDSYCRHRSLATPGLLELFRQVCAAVHYAHQNLIVHRDLKPGNILVTAEGTPKLLDFGIAKLLSPDAALVTATHGRPMTPHYASPEQIRDEPVTTQSDVYALGVVLYELLTGASPYRTRSDLPHELARAILEEEPDLPSVALRRQTDPASTAGSSEGPSTSPRFSHRLEGDLDNIVLRAMHKDPQRRYASAEQLSEDLRRYVEGLPVAARADTVLYRAGKFVTRHRLGVAVGTAAVLALLITTTAAVVQTWRSREALVEASRQRDVAESVTDFLRETFHAADPFLESNRPASTKELLDRGAQRAMTELDGQPELRAAVQLSLGRVYANMDLLAEAEAQLLQALETRLRLFGPENVSVAEVREDLGTVRLAQGRFPEAEGDLRASLRILLAEMGPDDLHVGLGREKVAAFEEHLGNYEEAEAQLRESVRILERESPAEHLPTSLIRLGSIMRARGAYAEAERSLLRALEILERELRPHHPRVLSARRILGDLYFDWGELERAEAHFRRALAGVREEQLDAREILNSLANVLRKTGELDEAERLYREAWELHRAELGEDNPLVTAVQVNLALVLQEKGRLDEAEPLARQVVEIDARHYGEKSPNLIPDLNNLGLLLQEKGEHEEAQELYLRAESLAREVLGDRHPAVAFPLNNRADLEYERGALEIAERLVRSALELRRATLPEGNVDLAPSLGGLGRVLVDTGRAEEAEPLLREAVAIRLKHLPPDDWHVAWAKSDLGACLLVAGRVEEAGALLEQGYAGLLAAKGAGHRHTVRAGSWVERLETARAAAVAAVQ
jgi:serine/threonine-protein kinase